MSRQTDYQRTWSIFSRKSNFQVDISWGKFWFNHLRTSHKSFTIKTTRKIKQRERSSLNLQVMSGQLYEPKYIWKKYFPWRSLGELEENFLEEYLQQFLKKVGWKCKENHKTPQPRGSCPTRLDSKVETRPFQFFAEFFGEIFKTPTPNFVISTN